VWHCDWIQSEEEKPKILMIGASMNCRGVGKKGMRIFLSDLIKEKQLDFIALQETIKKDYSTTSFRRIDHVNQFSWKWIPSMGRSGGILGGFKVSRFDILDTVLGRNLVLVYGAA
jgi:hypothetical protein